MSRGAGQGRCTSEVRDLQFAAKCRSLASLGTTKSGLLQSVQICQQVFNLLVGHDLAEAFHLGPSELNDFSHALVVGRQSTYRQILLLENAFQARALFTARRVWFMAPVAIVVIAFSAFCLLRVEAEFRIGPAALNIAALIFFKR